MGPGSTSKSYLRQASPTFKIYFIVKFEYVDTEVHITTDGKRHLGAHINPTSKLTHAFDASNHVTAPLVALIVRQELHHNQTNDLRKERNNVKKSRRERQEKQAKDIVKRLNPQLQCSLQLAQEKGSSSWLNKGEFCDALCLRY